MRIVPIISLLLVFGLGCKSEELAAMKRRVFDLEAQVATLKDGREQRAKTLDRCLELSALESKTRVLENEKAERRAEICGSLEACKECERQCEGALKN